MNDVLIGSGYSREELRDTILRLRALADDLEAACDGNVPRLPQTSISQWTVSFRSVPCLIGRVRGHPTVKGATARTSQVFFLDHSKGLARTFSRWYRLGKPNSADGDFH